MKVAGVDLPKPLADAANAARPHFIAAALFSVLINVLFLAPAIYMLQVYDRVLTTGGKMTLLFVTLALAIALITLAALDAFRSRLMVRASARLDAMLTPRILSRMLSVGGRENVQAMRDFDTVRQQIASPSANALLDLPWTPIFIIVCFLLHLWLGVFAIAAIGFLLVIAIRHQRMTAELMTNATRCIASSHASEQASSLHAGTLSALEWSRQW
jgi:ATP-binding cassette subfamily C protein